MLIDKYLREVDSRSHGAKIITIADIFNPLIVRVAPVLAKAKLNLTDEKTKLLGNSYLFVAGITNDNVPYEILQLELYFMDGCTNPNCRKTLYVKIIRHKLV